MSMVSLPYKLPSASEKRRTLRKLVESGKTTVVPGVFNSAVAMLAEKLGYRVVYAGGAITTLGMGLPDLGVITRSQMAYEVSKIASMTSIPVVADVDTGYGNIAKTIRVFEDVGASGFHIEDQEEYKKCGHLSNKKIVSTEEMVKKIKLAVMARRDANFIIIARTDARDVAGIEDAVSRANLYAEAGADMIFPEALLSKGEFKYFAKKVKAPLLANMTEYGRTPYISVKDFEKMGYTFVLFPVTTLRASLKTAEEILLEIKNKGTQKQFVAKKRMKTRKELQNLISYGKWERMINRNLAKSRAK